MKPIELSAAKLAQRIREKKISSEEITQQYIDQINKFNKQVNAVVQFNPERALLDAKKLDQLQAKGIIQGPLHGVPFTVKDIFNTKGDINSAGCLSLNKNIATEDATIVKRLKAAGGILLGKTNTPEFENSADTDNLVYGKTANPYDLSRSAGGSSGGSGAAVASCFCAFDIGADHGGSLRIPAHYNGITTLRSTTQRIPSTGVLYGFRNGPGAALNTEGPLARYTEDLELILKVIEGPDNIDPHIIPSQLLEFKTPVEKLRVAYFDSDSNSKVSLPIKSAIQSAAEALASIGIQVQHDAPLRIGEGFEIYQEISGPIATHGFKGLFQRYQVDQPSHLIKKQVENFIPYHTNDLKIFLARWDRWNIYRSDILKFFAKYDAFICPVTAQEALPLTSPMWEGQVNLLSFCWATSAALLPAVVVRAGTSETGLPIGIQIVTKPYYDKTALAIAKQIEDILGGWQIPPFK